jgi:hypothetical protein
MSFCARFSQYGTRKPQQPPVPPPEHPARGQSVVFFGIRQKEGMIMTANLPGFVSHVLFQSIGTTVINTHKFK